MFPLQKIYWFSFFPLDSFSDNMEINQGIGKSHGPLPSCVTPFLKYTSMGNYLYCGVSLVVCLASQQSQGAGVEQSLTRV